jgi:hypothetical protein
MGSRHPITVVARAVEAAAAEVVEATAIATVATMAATATIARRTTIQAEVEAEEAIRLRLCRHLRLHLRL